MSKKASRHMGVEMSVWMMRQIQHHMKCEDQRESPQKYSYSLILEEDNPGTI